MRRLAVFLALAPGCVAGQAGTMAPDGDDSVLELETPVIEGIEPGADITYCTYLDVAVEEDLDILSFLGTQGDFGHHTILYGARVKQDAGTHECTEQDMINARYLAAGGAEGGVSAVPEGIAFRLKRGQQLMIQSHFINASDHVISGQSHFALEVGSPDPSRELADLFTVVTTEIEIPPGSTGTAHASCPVAHDLQLVALGGHAHEWGTHVSVRHTPAAGGAARMLYDQIWSPEAIFNPTIAHFTAEDPLFIPAGDTLEVDCEYFNDTDEPLMFPSEMCVGWSFQFPADHEVDCVDGVWPGAGP